VEQPSRGTRMVQVMSWLAGVAVVVALLQLIGGGRILVEQSYADAKVKVTEQKAQRAATPEQRKGRRVHG
jgi:hypothetical protein